MTGYCDALTVDENFIICAIIQDDQWRYHRINVWRINSDLLHPTIYLLVEFQDGDKIKEMMSDKNELVVKADKHIILFDLETGDQMWKLRWDLHSNYQRISSDKIKQKIHYWKMVEFQRVKGAGRYRCCYSQFQLIWLIFE